MISKRFLCIFPAGVFLLHTAFAQPRFAEHAPPEPVRNKGNALLLHLSGGLQLPAADLADRFGMNGAIGGGLEWVTARNLIIGVEGAYYFGSKVKEDPLALLRTPEGDIIGNDRTLANVSILERGLYVGGVVGRLFPFGTKRAGLRVTLGAGYTRHKIRLQDESGTVVQIGGDYIKGYDRLTGGPALQQFIGWQHLAANRRINWLIGLEFQQGFTKTMRDWDFLAMRKLDGKRVDLRFGIRAAWTLPFYQRAASEIEY